jgi:putative transposase
MSRMDEKRISHNRQSNRLQGYDYSSPGYYFVTIVSHNRLPIFGGIISGEAQLNRNGKIVKDCWLEIPKHFQSVTLDEYVIMPNHLHGIVKINENQNVGARHKVSSIRRQASPYSINDKNTKPKRTPIQSLGAIFGSFKSAVTKQIHPLGLCEHTSVWQRNYYEHVIRDNEDYQRIVECIQFNPINSEDDQEFVPNDSLIR